MQVNNFVSMGFTHARDRVLKSYIVFILLFDENIKLYGSNDTLIYNSKHCNTQKIVKIFVPENKFNVVKLWLKSVSVQRFRSIIFFFSRKRKDLYHFTACWIVWKVVYCLFE